LKAIRSFRFFMVMYLSILIGSVAVVYAVAVSKNQWGLPGNNETNPAKTGETDWKNFTFTWGPDTQKVVEGTLRLEIGIDIEWETGNISIVIKVNDDDYDDEDYIGLVFDHNQNGYIDYGDQPYGLWANNMTAPAPSSAILLEHGFFGFAEVPPRQGPQECTFDPDEGYTFKIQFPYLFPEIHDDDGGFWSSYEWDPFDALKRGEDNSLHVCFRDVNAPYPSMGVFVQFKFHLE